MVHLNKSYPYQKQLKNRSSKHLGWLTGPGTKPILWSWSNEQLNEYSKRCEAKSNPYEAELNRRARNAAKRKTPRPSNKKSA